MSIKQLFAKKWAKRAVNNTNKWAQNPIATQEKVLKIFGIQILFLFRKRYFTPGHYNPKHYNPRTLLRL